MYYIGIDLGGTGIKAGIVDEEGNIILDENNEPILIPYRTYGGATALPNYDWTANPDGFSAEPYENGMVVY